ncbi:MULTISPECIES: GHKL domain-containing protein [unclassified Paenibacillus]|uniref:sensor histidine kinase n=1 Tax=unclassified Paenibacillus TaxID=185978 RepID=UPI0009568FAD|nr:MULTISPECIES: GHKL domain-containing protein [unclassified Paenibacillus]ASS66443.1 GHKL domain-containing protein [Paenibacillus sp. RUD330]SIQ04181.1 Sensor_kinase_SpoOB-type, alpha-helical domain [Paenibacillus sp. RU4X]SIQ24139.1 Sensor_kinase_SpoOB-type, alpha-helical domain [Paenibacillus sp. RU4T]
MNIDYSLLMRSATLYVFVSFPQSLIFTCFTFQFLGIRTEGSWKRMIGFVAASSLYTDLFFFELPAWAHFSNTILSIAFFLWLFFRKMSLRQRLVTQALLLVFVILSDMVTMGAAVQFTAYESVLSGPVWLKIAVCWPSFALFALAALLMERRNIHPGAMLKKGLSKAAGSSMFYFILVVSLQFMLLALLFLEHYVVSGVRQTSSLLLVLSVSTTAPVIFMALRLIAQARREGEDKGGQAFEGDLVRMLATIRGQRHDFINHVQTMHLMLKLGKREELTAYMGEVLEEIEAVNRVAADLAALPFPAVAALLSVKEEAAKCLGISLDYEIADLLRAAALPPLKSIDLVRITANLLDNAFDEAAELPAGQREVRLEASLGVRGMTIAVSNRCRAGADPALLQKMFRAGYSTKPSGSGHSGLGLSIVAERARHYRGTASARLEGSFLCVSVVLPCSPVPSGGGEAASGTDRAGAGTETAMGTR